MTDNYKEVYFGEYCTTCEHKNLKEEEDPCDECLSNPVNLYSHRPIKWKQNTKKVKETKDERRE